WSSPAPRERRGARGTRRRKRAKRQRAATRCLCEEGAFEPSRTEEWDPMLSAGTSNGAVSNARARPDFTPRGYQLRAGAQASVVLLGGGRFQAFFGPLRTHRARRARGSRCAGQREFGASSTRLLSPSLSTRKRSWILVRFAVAGANARVNPIGNGHPAPPTECTRSPQARFWATPRVHAAGRREAAPPPHSRACSPLRRRV